MKPLLLAAIALFAVLPAQAQDRDAERARIARERAGVEDRFAAARQACNARFAVTDCVEKVTRERKQALAELRRQERLLNAAERRIRAAQRLKEQEERNAPDQQRAAEERRRQAVQDQQEREARAAEKARKRAEDEAERAARPRRTVTLPGPVEPQGSPRRPQAAKSHGPTAAEAARNRAAYEERLREAAKRKKAVQERIARRGKPPAAPLPTPQ